MAYDNRRSNGDYGRKSYSRGGYGQKDFERDIARDSKPYKKPDGRKPYGKKFDDRQDKPYKKFDDKREDRPFKDKPFKDKPFKDKPLDKAAEDRREAPNTNEPDELPYIIMGRNAVREAVKSGRSIDRILVSKELDGSLREVVNLARDNNIQIREVDRYKLDEICMPFGHGGKPGNHQGILAQVPGVEYCDISDILRVARNKDEKPFIILLDGVEDPHNLGSIIRSAECAGAHGVIIPKRRSASVTAAACKASAGAVEYVPVARVTNIAVFLEEIKARGVWVYAADMDGTDWCQTDFSGPAALVVGSEGFGVSRLVKEKSDFIVSLPMKGRINSLNASVACGVLCYEIARQRAGIKAKG